MCDPTYLADDVDVCRAADVVTAVVPVAPPAIEAASVCKSELNAATAAIGSVAETKVVDVIVSLV